MRSVLFILAAACASVTRSSAPIEPHARGSAVEEPQPAPTASDWPALRAELRAARATWSAQGGAHPAARFLAPLHALARTLGTDAASVPVLAEEALLAASGARASVAGAEAACTEALAALLRDHADQSALADACERFGDAANGELGLDRAVAFLKEARTKSARADVREAAGLALARAWYDALDALPASGPRDLRALLKELAGAVPATRRSRAAADLVFAWDEVRIQRVLPDVPVYDTEGEPVLLSALRGQVVLVHVWSTLDDATRAELDAHAARSAANAKDPLVVMGVYAPPAEESGAEALPAELASVVERIGRIPRGERGALTDAERAALERVDAWDRDRARAAVRSAGIRWRVAVDGGKDGPWSRRHDVRRHPTTFVVDARGVLRYRDLPARELDLALDALIAEAAAPR